MDVQTQSNQQCDHVHLPILKSIQNKNQKVIESQIQVCVRIRPLLESEEDSKQVVDIDEKNNTLQIMDTFVKMQIKFDQAFKQSCTQEQVFNKIKQQLPDVLNGYNLTIFAYGQTGSGKTYTMFGADWESLAAKQENIDQQQIKQITYFSDINQDENYAGIIPRMLNYIFELIQQQSDKNKRYINPLQIHENKIEGVFIEGLIEFQVTNYNEALQLIANGEQRRAVRQTIYNTKSSRSHSIFQISIETTIPDSNGLIKKTRIKFCDLAGSEKLDIINQNVDQIHLEELKSINLSLTTLGKVIYSLSSQQKSKKFVPYRDSKLTRLLQDSLGGNAYTFIIANISPSQYNIQETLNTIKFAERASHIQQSVKPNESQFNNNEIISKLLDEINYLKNLIKVRRISSDVISLQQKYIQLQEENQKLKKTHISINDVQQILNENHKMKQQYGQNIQDENQAQSKVSIEVITKTEENNMEQTCLKSTFQSQNSNKLSKQSDYYDSKTRMKLQNQAINQINYQQQELYNQYYQNNNAKKKKKLQQKDLSSKHNIQMKNKSISLFEIVQNYPQSLQKEKIIIQDDQIKTTKNLALTNIDPYNGARMRDRYNNAKVIDRYTAQSNDFLIQQKKEQEKSKLRILERLSDIDRFSRENKYKLQQDLAKLELNSSIKSDQQQFLANSQDIRTDRLQNNNNNKNKIPLQKLNNTNIVQKLF